MSDETSKHVKAKSGNVPGNGGRKRHRTPPYIKILPDPELPKGDLLDLLGAQLRNNGSPITDGGLTDAQGPRDIRGALKVIDNVLFKHRDKLTPVYLVSQPHSIDGELTSVHMSEPNRLSERLESALQALKKRDPRASRAGLARACGVSKAAVTKWFKDDVDLKAENYERAATYLRVRAGWLRTSKPPREADEAEVETDIVHHLLDELRDPLSRLLTALEKLAALREQPKKVQRK